MPIDLPDYADPALQAHIVRLLLMLARKPDQTEFEEFCRLWDIDVDPASFRSWLEKTVHKENH
jgi:hypothetical protein